MRQPVIVLLVLVLVIKLQALNDHLTKYKFLSAVSHISLAQSHAIKMSRDVIKDWYACLVML